MKLFAKKLLTGGQWLENAVVTVENGTVTAIDTGRTGDICMNIVTSGLLDKHQHGAFGFDAANPTHDAWAEYILYLAKHGVTDFLYTLGTGPVEVTRNGIAFAAEMKKNDLAGAKVQGVHLEGPFVNPVRSGAMRADCMLLPNLSVFEELCGENEAMIRAITVAPELPGAFDFAEALYTKGIRVQAGHTDADYQICEEASKHCFTGFTHTFNAMRGIHHRDPGPEVFGMLKKGFNLEAICDFVHLSPEIIRLMFTVKGAEDISMVSDSGMVAGMPEGEYTAGNHYVRVENGRCFTRSGGISGSYRQMDTGVANLTSIGIAPEDAVKAGSETPAKYLGLTGLGDIAVGKKAHFAVWNDNMETMGSFIDDRLFEA